MADGDQKRKWTPKIDSFHCHVYGDAYGELVEQATAECRRLFGALPFEYTLKVQKDDHPQARTKFIGEVNAHPPYNYDELLG